MSNNLVVVGMGGFGREVVDLICDINAREETNRQWNLLGIFDDHPSPENRALLERQGFRWLGPVESGVSPDPAEDINFVIAVNDVHARLDIAKRLAKRGWKPATLVHPGAYVGSGSTMGGGTVICAGAVITTNVRLGAHVHVNPNATIGHDAVIGDYVSINPGASISGNVVLGDRTLIGGRSFIIQGTSLSPGTTVGACACVLSSTEDPTTLVGVPAVALDR